MYQALTLLAVVDTLRSCEYFAPITDTPLICAIDCLSHKMFKIQILIPLKYVQIKTFSGISKGFCYIFFIYDIFLKYRFF